MSGKGQLSGKDAKRHALWLIAAWARGTQEGGAVLHCPTCGDDEQDDCTDCDKIVDGLRMHLDAIEARGAQAVPSGEQP